MVDNLVPVLGEMQLKEHEVDRMLLTKHDFILAILHITY